MRKEVKQAGWLFLAIIIVHLAASFTLARIPFYTNLHVFAQLFVSQMLIVIPVLIFYLVTKTSPHRYMAVKKMKISTILLVIVFAYCMVPITAVINLITMLFADKGVTGMAGIMTDIPLLPGLLFIAVMPAVFEEFTFRGTFYGIMRKSGIVNAALVSGLLFGFMHLNFNQFAYAFVLGVMFVLLIEATGSLLAPMIAHFIINSNSVILNYLLQLFNDMLPGMEDTALLEESMQAMELADSQVMLMGFVIYLPLAIGAGVVAFFIYKQIAKNCGRTAHTKAMIKRKPGEKIISIPLIIAMVICLGYMVLIEFL